MRYRLLYLIILIAAHSVVAQDSTTLRTKILVTDKFPLPDGEAKWTYSNGIRAVIGEIEDSLKVGTWSIYDITGHLTETLDFKKNLLNGWNRKFNGGYKIYEAYYVGGILDGPFYDAYYMKDEELLIVRGQYKNGEKDSTWIEYYPGDFVGSTREVKSVKNYANGKANGTWTHYYPFGRVQAEELYRNNIEYGTWRTYYPNKQVEKEFSFKNGLLSGPYKEYFQSGKVSVEGQYENGLKTGKWVSLIKEGILFSIGDYRLDQKTGIWKFFNETGQLESEGKYANDMKEGQWIYYDENGKLQEIGSFVHGEKDGLWGLFYENEQLKQEQVWQMGKLTDISPFYSIKGEELKPGTFSSGNGTVLQYNEEEKLISEETYKNGILNGPAKYYDDAGVMIESGEFTNGIKTGIWQEFHSNGIISAKGSYLNGLRQGIWTIYTRRGVVLEYLKFEEGEAIREE